MMLPVVVLQFVCTTDTSGVAGGAGAFSINGAEAGDVQPDAF